MSPGLGQAAVVIENDPDIRALICDVLSRSRLRTIGAVNGADGIAAVREFDPVVVTVDLRLPGIDGIETTKQIRAMSSALIVVLSARVTDADEFDSRRAGADVYLPKPFRPKELRAQVEAHLRQERRA